MHYLRDRYKTSNYSSSRENVHDATGTSSAVNKLKVVATDPTMVSVSEKETETSHSAGDLPARLRQQDLIVQHSKLGASFPTRTLTGLESSQSPCQRPANL